MEENCIFCKMFRGEISTIKFVESNNFFVIKDIHPKTRGHSLVISKEHYVNFSDLPLELYSELLETTKKAVLILIEEEKADGFNLVMNNQEVAGQVIGHAHLHILPRYKDDGFKLNV